MMAERKGEILGKDKENVGKKEAERSEEKRQKEEGRKEGKRNKWERSSSSLSLYQFVIIFPFSSLLSFFSSSCVSFLLFPLSSPFSSLSLSSGIIYRTCSVLIYFSESKWVWDKLMLTQTHTRIQVCG